MKRFMLFSAVVFVVAILSVIVASTVASAGFTTEIYGKGTITSKTIASTEGGTNLLQFGKTEGTYNQIAGSSSVITTGLSVIDKTVDSDNGIYINTVAQSLGQISAHDSVGMLDSMSNIPKTLCDPSLAVADSSQSPKIQYPSYQNVEGQVGLMATTGKYQSSASLDGTDVDLRASSYFEGPGRAYGDFRGLIEQGVDENSSTLNFESIGRSHDANVGNGSFAVNTSINYKWVFGKDVEELITENSTDRDSNLTERIDSAVNSTNERTD